MQASPTAQHLNCWYSRCAAAHLLGWSISTAHHVAIRLLHRVLNRPIRVT